MNYEDHLHDSFKDSVISLLTYLSQPLTTPTAKNHGLCYAIHTLETMWCSHNEKDGEEHIALHQLSINWDHYSGDIQYPVPGIGNIDPYKMFNITPNVWIGEYGDLRKDLCKYLVTQLESSS